ncbi:zinc finger protein 239 isoform X3 [Drosophila takahashii]|uniref:zinc finger protein 239 isoform X3 n=1 Tax=Drosophila takahashii TaxID=29030 RepID=UPI003899655A
MESSICRACLLSDENMVNIYDAKHESGISIANMISQCTGCKVEKDDLLPKTICSVCLQDAQNAFDIIETYERSHHFFCYFRELREEERDNEGSYCSEEDTPKEVESIGDNGQTKTCEIDQTDSEAGMESSEEDLEQMVLRENPFQCLQCSRILTSKENLQGHLRTHTGERPFKCSKCPKSYTRSSGLKNHLPVHSGERPFKCKHCSTTYVYRSDFRVHLRTHTGERPFKCSHCPKSFTTSSNLIVHLRIHTGERPFKCSQCPKSFAQSSSLSNHLRTHTGERPFKCSQCLQSFTHNSVLKAHLRTHTGERPFKCSHCPKSFTRSASLTEHLRTHK